MAPYRVYNEFKEDLTGYIEEQFVEEGKEQIRKILVEASITGEQPKELPAKRMTSTKIVNDTLLLLKSRVVLPWDREAPFWVQDDGSLPHPLSMMPMGNGVLDLDKKTLMTATPNFFSPIAIPYDYDPDAKAPDRWVSFMNELWPDDPAPVRELQKWFGLCLTPDSSYQKVFVLIGPTRSGNGTIIRILEAMLGGLANVHSASLNSLVGRFGLQPLLDKSVAIFKDLRESGKVEDRTCAIERMLNISGEDSLSIERKGITNIEQKLFARLMIVSNAFTNLRDPSGALAARMVPIQMRVSFKDNEDTTLTDTFLAGLPGILNWAIEGRRMLQEDGRFIIPKSASTLHDSIEPITSPIKTFADECLDKIEGQSIETNEDELQLQTVEGAFMAWREWCLMKGHVHGSDGVFTTTLKSAFPFVEAISPNIKNHRRQSRIIGMRLNDHGRELARNSEIRLAPLQKSKSY